MKKLSVSHLALIIASIALFNNLNESKASTIVGGTLPGTCTIGDQYLRNSSNGEAPGFYSCNATNSWTLTGGTVPPSGSIILIISGSCPSGYTEVSALNGKTLFGTVTANADVGGTGGNDNITPAGTNGNTGAEAAHTHTGGAISIGTFVNTAGATTGNCAATNIAAGTGSTTACKATAPNLTTAAQGHSGSLSNGTTGAGSSHLHAGPTFTGTQFDNRSAFTKVIFCSKN